MKITPEDLKLLPKEVRRLVSWVNDSYDRGESVLPMSAPMTLIDALNDSQKRVRELEAEIKSICELRPEPIMNTRE